ncbi:MAG TPA: DUF72 domain-containing protein [Burkholderiaceae bacterium]|nr:DUF72 domain-containing protein [Burkholderiaceae bacterium]
MPDRICSSAMQDHLFAIPSEPDGPVRDAPSRAAKSTPKVQPQVQDPALHALRATLGERLWLGTSSWSYPGWGGLVWDGDYAESALSKHGLPAYAEHPLFRTVSLDRAFYRPLTASQYAGFAHQVPQDFRFVVKAPSLVTDAMVRSETGRGMQANPAFLSEALAISEFVQPALAGLGHKIGALVFQLSPLPAPLLARLPEVLARLGAMLRALPPLHGTAPDAVVAVEVRDPAFLTRAFAAVLREAGATYCLGVHAKMPPVAEQLPMLRALWPGPLVCRWNLNRKHGAYGYEEAGGQYQPFDRLVDPDPETRAALARVVAGTTGAGQNAYVTVSNQAEGCAPLTVIALAEEIRARI